MRAWRVHVTPPSDEVAKRSGVRLSGESLNAATSVLFGRLMMSICKGHHISQALSLHLGMAFVSAQHCQGVPCKESLHPTRQS